jgi:hypothetical protein
MAIGKTFKEHAQLRYRSLKAIILHNGMRIGWYTKKIRTYRCENGMVISVMLGDLPES